MLKTFIDSFLKPLELNAIPAAPLRAKHQKKESRTTEHVVDNGREAVETVYDNGTIETEYRHQPKEQRDVKLDRFDREALNEVIGPGWEKEESRAVVMKWHWQNQRSANQIEKYHTTPGGKLQKGYSERTAATYIKAMYQADDARDIAGIRRLRNPVE